MTDKKAKKENNSDKVETLVNEISKLTVLELSELVKTLQEKLGVSAMPVTNVAATVPNQTAQEEKPVSTSNTQTLTMTAAGENKIAVIKALREINSNLGLKEAKDMTEQLPAEILKDAKEADATSAVNKLKTAGATVEVK